MEKPRGFSPQLLTYLALLKTDWRPCGKEEVILYAINVIEQIRKESGSVFDWELLRRFILQTETGDVKEALRFILQTERRDVKEALRVWSVRLRL